MPWNKDSDTAATFPPLMRVAGLPRAQPGDVNQVAGFIWRCSLLSSQHTQDYYVDAGTVAMAADGNQAYVLPKALKLGLLTKHRIDGLVAYKIIDDPDFINMRLRAEIEWERQQRRDTRDLRLSVPVRHRDGDGCRYCGVPVQWRGRPSARKGTLDHLNPGQPGTVDTMVVACMSCNGGLRDQGGEEREDLRPPPDNPYYSEFTAEFLTSNGKPVPPSPSDQRPASKADTAPPATRPKSGPRAISDPPARRTTRKPKDSDPAPAGPRVSAPTVKAEPKSVSDRISQPVRTSSAGSGREGERLVRNPAGTAAARPRRSRRGKP